MRARRRGRSASGRAPCSRRIRHRRTRRAPRPRAGRRESRGWRRAGRRAARDSRPADRPRRRPGPAAGRRAARTAGSRRRRPASPRASPGRRRRTRRRARPRSVARAAAAVARAGRTGRARTAARGGPAGRDRSCSPTIVGRALEPAFELGHLGRLHQTEMARRQLEPRIARQAGQHRLRETVVAGAPQQRLVLGAGDPVEARTPAISTSSRWRVKPSTSAAAEAAMPRASTTRITGRSSRLARSAVEPWPSPAPSNRPITPSPSTRSTPSATRSASAGERLDAHRPAVEIERRPAGRAAHGTSDRCSRGRP